MSRRGGENDDGRPSKVSAAKSHGGRERISSQDSASHASTNTMVASHLVLGETRFPTAMSYASDAPRSDVGTVCSGSVVEDIELESVISADLNTGNITSNTNTSTLHPSPPSSVIKMSVATTSTLNTPTERERLSFGNSLLEEEATRAAAACSKEWQHASALHGNNMMGPPLSRLLQHHLPEGNSSQAGSVKSFESCAGSDVIAHVGSDCGGSLDDMHSIHSQEDVAEEVKHNNSDCKTETKTSPERLNRSEDGVNTNGTAEAAGTVAAVNPLLCSENNTANGRISPGGTIYRGKGNRRYQGRYMNLPLKRFHQNGVDLAAANDPGDREGDVRNGALASGECRNSEPYDTRNGGWNGGRSRSPPDRYNNRRNGYHRSTRSRSRSRSRSREREREYDRDRSPGFEYTKHHHRSARRWDSYNNKNENYSNNNNNNNKNYATNNINNRGRRDNNGYKGGNYNNGYQYRHGSSYKYNGNRNKNNNSGFRNRRR